jgi:hypothetical protein
MSFVTLGALLVALFIAAPVAAHLLRRKRAEERAFPPTALVPATPPLARQRSLLEDRALFATRALSIVALAVLGATPFMHCSRLAVTRRAGASVALAIVIDDSLSMRAPLDGGAARRGATTRFDRAKAAALELVGGAYRGDAVAIVLAGAPARVALASTADMSVATSALEALGPSDRATDLSGATALAQELLKSLVQPDKRVVLLSDLADGRSDDPPLGGEALWAPLDELRASGADCAITRADRSGSRVFARVACTREPAESTASPSEGRALEVREGDTVVGRVDLGPSVTRETLAVDVKAAPSAKLYARLTGSDAIAEDDEAPVVAEGTALTIATVIDAASSQVATGGPPPVEQALAALGASVAVRPLPGVPDHVEELSAYAALVLDDPPGLTPEARRSLATWIERGGVALLTLGPRAGSAPLGAGFEPLIPGVVRWSRELDVEGIAPSSAPTFGAAALGLERLAPRGRALIDARASEGAAMLARWSDGPPLLFRRQLGRGALFALTLPLSTDESDLALRPAFIALLDRLINTTKARGGANRIDAGEAWVFDGFSRVDVRRAATSSAPALALPLVDEGGRLRATPGLAGVYELSLDGDGSTRVVAIAERELDLRPRRLLPETRAPGLGGLAESIDVSPHVALALLGLLAVELLLRTIGQRRARSSAAGMDGAR